MDAQTTAAKANRHRRPSTVRSSPAAVALLLGLAGLSPAQAAPANPGSLRSALSFLASFDHGPNADFARGDGRLHHAPAMNQRAKATIGLPAESPVQIVPRAGRHGAALRFSRKSDTTVFYQSLKNLPYRSVDWSGSVSFWLRTDPAADLAPGYCDPVQITSKAWNDAAFFVEFEKKKEGIPFRLGVYADFKVWNPQNRKWEEIPAPEKPLLTVPHPPFAGDRWTHVVFTFDGFNTQRQDGNARLYLDGKLEGTIATRTQTFTWTPEQAHVMLGLGYVGFLDELALFDRALSADEIRQLHALSTGAAALLK